MDVEGVRHDEMACEMRCPWYCRNERAQQVGTWCCRGWCVWRPRARAAAGSGRGGAGERANIRAYTIKYFKTVFYDELRAPLT